MLKNLLELYKRNQKTIRLLAFIAVMVLFGLYAYYNWDQFERLANISILEIVLIVIGQLMIILSSTLMFRLVSSISSTGLPFYKAFQINTYSALVNFFGFLQGGVGIRAAYLKVKQKVKIKDFLSLTLLQYLSLFYISITLIIFSLVFINGSELLSLVILLPGIVAVPLIYSLVTKRKIFISFKITKTQYLSFFVINLLQIAGCILSYGTELHVVGANFSFTAIVLYAAVTQFAIVLAITPGALGVKEFLLIIVSQQMGLTLDDIVLSSTLDRLILFITFVIILPVAFSIKKDMVNIKNTEENSQT